MASRSNHNARAAKREDGSVEEPRPHADVPAEYVGRQLREASVLDPNAVAIHVEEPGDVLGEDAFSFHARAEVSRRFLR